MTFDVVLVTDSSANDNWSRGYGAHRIATHLRQHGFTVLVLDFCSKLNFELWEQIVELSVGDNTKLVGFSSTWWPYRIPFTDNKDFRTCNIEWFAGYGENPEIDTSSLTYHAIQGQCKPWIDIVKKKNKKIKVVLGGPKLDWYLDFPADYFISGLGENQIIDLLTDNRRLWPKVLQHDINSNNRDWGWTTSSTKYTKYDQLRPGEKLNLEISRGCKFKCNFCSFPLVGQKNTAEYLKTEETIYNELMDNYNQWGITQYFIADDTYNDSVEKLEMMLRVRKRLPFDFKYKAYLRVDVIATQPKQIQLLLDGGLASTYIGFESFHPQASKFAGKGMDSTKRKQILYEMNRVWGDKVSIMGGYIVGLQGEDEAFVRQQAEWFAQDDCPVNHGVSFLGLVIHPYKEGSHTFPSEIDRNPEKFGYTIPDMSMPNHWVKEDDTGINSYSKANALANEMNQYVRSRRKFPPDNIDYKAGGINDPVTEYFLPLIEMLKK